MLISFADSHANEDVVSTMCGSIATDIQRQTEILKDYYPVFQSLVSPPTAHILLYHTGDLLRRFGSISHRSCESFEAKQGEVREDSMFVNRSLLETDESILAKEALFRNMARATVVSWLLGTPLVCISDSIESVI